MSEEKELSHIWYFRRGEQSKGPFPVGQIQRFVLLGRIHLDDEVSADGRQWRPLTAVPELIPDVMRDANTPASLARLSQARLREDERLDADRRRGSQRAEAHDTDRRRSDRRRAEDSAVVQHRLVKADLLHELRARRPRFRVQMIVTAVLVIGIGAGYLLATPHRVVPARQCGQSPHPGIDWETCQLEGLTFDRADLRGVHARNANLARTHLAGAILAAGDLSYSRLTEADLRGADLRGAQLVGADLRGVDLTGADLRTANLAYADLTGAKLAGAKLAGAHLDKAIWPDRSVCAPGSVSGCYVGK